MSAATYATLTMVENGEWTTEPRKVQKITDDQKVLIGALFIVIGVLVGALCIHVGYNCKILGSNPLLVDILILGVIAASVIGSIVSMISFCCDDE